MGFMNLKQSTKTVLFLALFVAFSLGVLMLGSWGLLELGAFTGTPFGVAAILIIVGLVLQTETFFEGKKPDTSAIMTAKDKWALANVLVGLAMIGFGFYLATQNVLPGWWDTFSMFVYPAALVLYLKEMFRT